MSTKCNNGFVEVGTFDKHFAHDEKPKFAVVDDESKRAEFTRVISCPIEREKVSIHIDDFPIDIDIIKVVDMLQVANGQWRGRNVTDEYLDACPHTSWVYFLTVDGYIVKIGESGVTLYNDEMGISSKARLNKYFGYNDKKSERYIRSMLLDIMTDGKLPISFYAVPLPTEEFHIQVGNFDTQLATVHKVVELQAIDTFKEITGAKPLLNKYRK